jgi:hypothetical protein
LPDCPFTLSLTLLERPVLLATDSPRIAEILGEVFGDASFAPTAAEPAAEFRCCTGVNAPWVVAFADPDGVALAAPSGEGSRFELHDVVGGNLRPAGCFSFDEAQLSPTRDTVLELFATHLQRSVLRWLLRDDADLRLVHAGCLSWRDRGVLVLADSFGGKSTLTLAAVMAGLGFLSDDLSAVDMAARELLPFPRAIRLRQSALELVPAFADLCHRTTVDTRGDTRYYVRPDDIRPGAVGGRVPLTHIVTTAALLYGDCFATGDIGPRLMWRWAEVLQTVRCARLMAGPPELTAALLQHWLDNGADI